MDPQITFLKMMLKMSAATLLYSVLTALAFYLWQKSRKTTGTKIAIGLFYGLCSIASNHLGIDYGMMMLNVRDIGPLAAGLFFSPLSGVLAGTIGGLERYLIGEYAGIGTFTHVACGLSTFLAGLLSAVMHRKIYRGQRPSVIHCLLTGSLMEVFHMYSILLTRRDEMSQAYFVVRECSAPMILFNAIGLALCSAVVMKIAGEQSGFRLRKPSAQVPLFNYFQRWLLAGILLLFMLSSLVSFAFQTRISLENEEVDLQTTMRVCLGFYEEHDEDTTLFRRQLENQFVIMDEQIMLIDGKTSVYSSPLEPVQRALSGADMQLVRKNAGKDCFQARLDCYYGFPFLCCVERLDDQYYVMVCRDLDTVYLERDSQLYENAFSSILIFTILFLLISWLVDYIVVRNVKEVNRALNRITNGKLDEVVDVRRSVEFSKLSDHINATVAALRGYIDQAKERMAADLKMAAAIQESALPHIFTFGRNEFEIYALMNPAKEVGGDFYDFFFVNADTMVLVIADVSGKSIPAALFMMRAKTSIKTFARSGNGPAELLGNVNRVLCEENQANMFITVWIGIIDLPTGRMRCANAGHEYPVVMPIGGEYSFVKDRHSLALGIMAGIPITEYELTLRPGDRLFVYTDGVPEAINEQKEAYGPERMLAKLNTLRNAGEKETLTALREDVRAFEGAEEQFDDITMIGFTYFGPGGPHGNAADADGKPQEQGITENSK